MTSISSRPTLSAQPESDDSLLAAVATGSSIGAFETLVERYSKRVFALVVRMVGSAPDAEEITQDVMMRVFDRAGAFSGQSTVSTWIYRIAYNQAIDHMRRVRPDRASTSEPMPDMADNTEADPDEERLAQLNVALRRLEPADRALLTLYYYDSHSVGEIAEIMHLSPSNVKIRLMRLRDRLRKSITTLSPS